MRWGIVNLSLTSRGGETQHSVASSITKALSFNKKLFVFQNTLVSSDQAERFLAQAVTMGDSIDIQQTMAEAAMDTQDMKIRCDPSLKVLNKSEVSLWRTRLSHLQIARLVSQYFGKRHDEKRTLAVVFSKVKFQYCIDNEDHEILMMADYKEVIKGVVLPGIPGLRAVPDLVTIHPILPPTVHIQPYHD